MNEIMVALIDKLKAEAIAFQSLHKSTGRYSLSYSGGYLDGLSMALKLVRELEMEKGKNVE